MRLTFQRYARPFARPLQTSRGLWSVREGLLVTLDGQTAEVCPLPDFGTETTDEAEAWLRDAATIYEQTGVLPEPPEGLPCCRSARAFSRIALPVAQRQALVNTALLPAGQGAITALETAISRGFRSFKLKIGVADAATEVTLAQCLLVSLPADASLRLDANGAFPVAETGIWQGVLAHPRLAFVEQPLPVGQEAEASAWANAAGCRIAFDESVAQLPSLERLAEQYLSAVFVVKPSLIGEIAGLLAWRMRHPEVPLVISSSFESAVGAGWVMRLAKCLPGQLLPVGLGTGSVCNDGLGGYPDAPLL